MELDPAEVGAKKMTDRTMNLFRCRCRVSSRCPERRQSNDGGHGALELERVAS